MADTLAQVQKDVRFWQRLLTFAGYQPGKVDGVNGSRLRICNSENVIPDACRYTFMGRVVQNVWRTTCL